MCSSPATPKAARWLPTFHTLGGASFGFQAGADSAEVIMLAMTESGLNNLLSSSVKLGGDVSVAVGGASAGAGAATAGLSADILIYSAPGTLRRVLRPRAPVVSVRDSFNKAYYGKEVTPTHVLLARHAEESGVRPASGSGR